MPQQKPQAGPSSAKKSPQVAVEEGKPNLQKIGQKLGLAVSITSVGEKEKEIGENEKVVEEEQIKEEAVNIKTEPGEVSVTVNLGGEY